MASASRILFETPRLHAVPLDADAIEDLLRVYGDPDTVRWVDDGQPITRADCERWVAVTRENVRRRGYGMVRLLDPAGGAAAGFAGLVHPGGQVEAELKYALAPPFRGRGLATEAAGALLDWGRREHGLGEVIATIHPDNHASRAVVAHLGFRREADRIEADGSPTCVYRWRAP